MSVDKFEHLKDWKNWIGKRIVKHSGKPFKSGKKIGVPQLLVENPYSGKQGFKMNDESIVDCHQCILLGYVTRYSFIRLLSYPEACHVIEFVNKNELNYSNITVGGVSINAVEKDWDGIIEFLDRYAFRYELCDKHPTKVTTNIIQHLKE